jgi:hypothetical protein
MAPRRQRLWSPRGGFVLIFIPTPAVAHGIDAPSWPSASFESDKIRLESRHFVDMPDTGATVELASREIQAVIADSIEECDFAVRARTARAGPAGRADQPSALATIPCRFARDSPGNRRDNEAHHRR